MTKMTCCPVCRGEIHAIAGRCKHCKADLVDLRNRAARAARAHAMGAVVPPPPMQVAQVPPPQVMPPPEAAQTWVDVPPEMSAGTPPMGTPELPPVMIAPPPMQETWRVPPARRRTTSWSRRWPLLVSAVALLAIGVSIGMLAERWRSGRTDGDGRVRNAATRPHQVPDHMPLPLMPAPNEPRQVDPNSDPAAPAPVPDPTPPGSGSRFGLGGQPGDAGAFRSFTGNLTESLCKKLSECGVIDSATQSVCQAFAQEFDPEDAASKIARGECSFNQRSADACLKAVANLRCDATGSNDMMDWLMASNKVGECAEAYTCQ